MERIMVVPLRKARRGSRARFAPKAVRFLRSFVARHMKAEEENVKIGDELNEFIWSRGIKNPPRRVEVRALKKGDTVYVEIASVKEEKWKKFIGEEEKKEKKARKEEKKGKEEEKAKEVLEEIAKETKVEEKKKEQEKKEKRKRKEKKKEGKDKKEKKKGTKK